MTKQWHEGGNANELPLPATEPNKEWPANGTELYDPALYRRNLHHARIAGPAGNVKGPFKKIYSDDTNAIHEPPKRADGKPIKWGDPEKAHEKVTSTGDPETRWKGERAVDHQPSAFEQKWKARPENWLELPKDTSKDSFLEKEAQREKDKEEIITNATTR